MATEQEIMRTLSGLLVPVTFPPGIIDRACIRFMAMEKTWFWYQVLLSQALDREALAYPMAHLWIDKNTPSDHFRAAALYEVLRSERTKAKFDKEITTKYFPAYTNPFGSLSQDVFEAVEAGERVTWAFVKAAYGISDFRSFPRDDDELMLLLSLYRPRRADIFSIASDVVEQGTLYKKYPELAGAVVAQLGHDPRIEQVVVDNFANLKDGIIQVVCQSAQPKNRHSLQALVQLVRPRLTEFTPEERLTLVRSNSLTAAALLPELVNGLPVDRAIDQLVMTIARIVPKNEPLADLFRTLYGQSRLVLPSDVILRLPPSMHDSAHIAIWQDPDLARSGRSLGIETVLPLSLVNDYGENVTSGQAPMDKVVEYIQIVEGYSRVTAKEHLESWLTNVASMSFDRHFDQLARLVVDLDVRVPLRWLNHYSSACLTDVGYQWNDEELNLVDIVPYWMKSKDQRQPHLWKIWYDHNRARTLLGTTFDLESRLVSLSHFLVTVQEDYSVKVKVHLDEYYQLIEEAARANPALGELILRLDTCRYAHTWANHQPLNQLVHALRARHNNWQTWMTDEIKDLVRSDISRHPEITDRYLRQWPAKADHLFTPQEQLELFYRHIPTSAYCESYEPVLLRLQTHLPNLFEDLVNWLGKNHQTVVNQGMGLHAWLYLAGCAIRHGQKTDALKRLVRRHLTDPHEATAELAAKAYFADQEPAQSSFTYYS